MNSPEFPKNDQEGAVEPAIECMISSALEANEGLFVGEELHKFRKSEEGDKIGTICYALGSLDRIEESTKLTALRYVRKFSRQIHGGPIEERDFDFPMMSDHYYWKHVDLYFMQFIELQARNNNGNFYGQPEYENEPNGRTSFEQVALVLGTLVSKSAVVNEGEPIHVFYRAERPIVQDS